MQYLSQDLLEEYQFWEKKLTEFDKQNFPGFISTNEVLKGYYILIDYFRNQGEKLSYGIKDFSLIGSAVGRQFTSWNGKPKWPDKYHIAASLFFGLNKNHAFNDGNKRTSLLILLYFWVKNNFMFVDNSGKEFESLALRTASNELSKYSFYEKYKNDSDMEIHIISHVIKKLIRKADKSYSSLTYQEFFQKLHRYGFLYEISSTYANVYKIETHLFSKKPQKILLKQIGCPGLKRQINIKAAKSVLKACNITYENGYDFKSFLEGNESIYKIISDFEAPLRRLKDK